MAKDQPGFYRLNAGVFISNSLVGAVQIERLGDSLGETIATKPVGDQVNNTSTAIAATAGQLIDPKNPNIKIQYTLDGRTLSSREILSAVLAALVTAGGVDDGSLQAVTGKSVSGETEFYLGGIFGASFPASEATRAIYLVALELVVAFRLYGEMTFRLFTHGRWVANGMIRSLAVSGGNETRAIDTA